MNTIENFATGIFTLSVIGFAVAYAVVIIKAFGQPVRAFFSSLL